METSAIAALAVSAGPSAGRIRSPSQLRSTRRPLGSGQADATGAIGCRVPRQSPTQPTEIVVSVTGLVDKPGIVTLPAGARVADAIAAAGGAAEGADLTGLNLAARLADGDSVVVGRRRDGAMRSPASPAAPVDRVRRPESGDRRERRAGRISTPPTRRRWTLCPGSAR